MSDLHDAMLTLGLSNRPKLAPRSDLLNQITERSADKNEVLEIGDKDFPLTINRSEINRKHKLVGAGCKITKFANEVLRSHRGHAAKVSGVIVRDGQIAGFEVKMMGKRFLAPKKDIVLMRGLSIPEDVYLNGADTVRVRKLLSNWIGQRDYIGTEWGGVEWLCFALARATNTVSIESAGWYKYKSSSRPDQDGKDWRYVLPHSSPLVSVNCHSLLHDSVWTLATTVFDTKNSIDRSKLPTPITHEDAWTRSMLWALETSRVLAKQGFSYERAKKDMQHRMTLAESLRPTLRQAMSDVKLALRLYFKDEPNHPRDQTTIVVADWGVATGSIGQWEVFDKDTPFAALHVRPSAFNSEKSKQAPPRRTKLRPGKVQPYRYADYVVLHEVLHSALYGDMAASQRNGGHDGKFKEMAKILGLPLRLAD